MDEKNVQKLLNIRLETCRTCIQYVECFNLLFNSNEQIKCTEFRSNSLIRILIFLKLMTFSVICMGRLIKNNRPRYAVNRIKRVR